jgi:predicted GTPase
MSEQTGWDDQRIEDALRTVAQDTVNLATEVGLHEESPAIALPPALSRLGKPRVTVVVVGEVSRGKSTLINALLGEKLLPHDFRATTSTWVLIRYGDEFAATVYLAGETGRLEEVELRSREDLDIYLSATGDRERRFSRKHRDSRVVSVDLRLPSEILASGIEIVDTPGVGGLLAVHRAAALEALNYADAVLFVTKPGSPLSRSELAFFAAATEHVAAHVLVQTHRDQVPDGTASVKADRATLANPATWAGVLGDPALAQATAERFASTPGVSVSAKMALDAAALAEGDIRRELYEDSQLPKLREILDRDILDHSRALHQRNVRSLSGAALRTVRSDAGERIAILEGEETQQAHVERLERLLDQWLKADGDYWRQSFDASYAELREKIRKHARNRAQELGREYRGRFARMSRDEIKATVEDQLLGEPETVLLEMVRMINQGMSEMTDRIKTLLESEGIIGGFEDAEQDGGDPGLTVGSRLDQAGQNVVDPTMARDVVVGGMAGVGVAGALFSLGVITTVAAPIVIPFLLGAGIFAGINYLMKRKERTVEAAEQALDQVITAIETTAYEQGIEILADQRKTIVRDVSAVLAGFEKKVERARQRLRDAATMDAGQRTRRITEARAQDARAADLIQALQAIPGA